MINILSSILASTIRLWSGTNSSKTVKQPIHPVILYDRESCPRCRLIREALTSLNLDVEVRPCPLGGERFICDIPNSRTPYLYDPNNRVKLTSTGRIIDYLFENYAGTKAPTRFKPSILNLARSSLASTVRLNAGSRKAPARAIVKPMILYSFESSPYSRLVREQLSELEIAYLLINLGKQQWADMGPAAFRFSMGAYAPLPNTKRSIFFEQHGIVQVPYLEDPNTGVSMFESRNIVHYLQSQYLLH